MLGFEIFIGVHQKMRRREEIPGGGKSLGQNHRQEEIVVLWKSHKFTAVRVFRTEWERPSSQQ